VLRCSEWVLGQHLPPLEIAHVVSSVFCSVSVVTSAQALLKAISRALLETAERVPLLRAWGLCLLSFSVELGSCPLQQAVPLLSAWGPLIGEGGGKRRRFLITLMAIKKLIISLVKLYMTLRGADFFSTPFAVGFDT
jgi:hypothetical protein